MSVLATERDLAAALEVELRPVGSQAALARWKNSVRIGPTVLCRGIGVALANEKAQDLGTLPILLEDPYYVEFGRAADTASLRARRAQFDFADVVPSLVETSSLGDRKFALVVGPVDRAVAEKLRWALLDRKVDAATGLGADYVGALLRVPGN